MNKLAGKIKNVFSDVMELIESEYGLLDNLIQSDVLTQAEHRSLQYQAVDATNRMLLDFIEHKSEKQCEKFIDALMKTDQQHVANFILATGQREQFGDCWPLDSQREVIKNNRLEIIKLLEVDCDLIEELRATECFTQNQITQIEKSNSKDKIHKLIDILNRRSVKHLKDFVTCVDKFQPHVVRLISGKTTDAMDENLQPLDESQRNIIHRRSKDLNHDTRLEPGLLDHLYERYCITLNQCNSLKGRDSMDYQRNRDLYEMMSRKSVAKFKVFIDCLKNTGQQHVVDILTAQPGSSSETPVDLITIDDVTVIGPDCSVDIDDKFHRYQMNRGDRGQFIIINNLTSQPIAAQCSMIDQTTLERDFKRLGFRVTVHTHQTANEMLQLMIKAAGEDHSKSDCFGVALITSCHSGMLSGVDTDLCIETFVQPIRDCRTLVGKPKICIIVGDRGHKHGSILDVTVEHFSDYGRTKMISQDFDRLFVHATFPGYASWPHTTKGSCFVRALHKMINKHAFDMEFSKLLTLVNHEVAYEFESKSKQKNRKQMPIYEHNLTKDIFFNKKTETTDLSADKSDVDRNNSNRYRMDHKKRGQFIIINNTEFQGALSKRRSSDVDAESIRKDFELLGFTVTTYTNQTADEMRSLMYQVCCDDHTDADCFGLAVLSYGIGNVLYGTDDAIDVERLIWQVTACRTLAGKPKIFIFQLDGGKMLDQGIDLADDSSCEQLEQKVPKRIPVEADMVYAFSTIPDCVSHQHESIGTYYVEALHRMLDEYAFRVDFVTLLTRVSNQLAYHTEQYGRPSYAFCLNPSSLVSSLTKNLYFIDSGTSPAATLQSDPNNSTDDISCFRYHMGHGSRGRLITIANRNFQPESGITEKRVTHDEFRLAMDFHKLGFNDVFYADQPIGYMLDRIKSVAEEDHSDTNCVAVAVFSEGDSEVVYGIDGPMSIDSFLKPLKDCKSLANKPKIILFVTSRSKDASNLDCSIGKPVNLGPDFLCIFSHASGFVPGRESGFSGSNWKDCSCFVQALHLMLDKYASTIDFARILTRVKLCVESSCLSVESHNHSPLTKQCPVIISTLTKEIYFGVSKK